MKNVKLLAAAGMLSPVSFASFAHPVSVTATPRTAQKRKSQPLRKNKALPITLPKRTPATGPYDRRAV